MNFPNQYFQLIKFQRMKKTSIAILTVLATVAIFSCVKKEDFEEEKKNYNCTCTYIAISGGQSAGQPDKKETTALNDRTEGTARVDCASLGSKYGAQYFEGTCTLD